MKKITITICITWLISTFVISQGWVKTFGNDTIFATSGMRTQDGGFILSGKKNARAYQQGALFLLKTNSDGDTQWLREYVPEGLGDFLLVEEFTTKNGIVELGEGGYVISTPFRWETGGSPEYYLGTYIQRTDAAGNELWSQYHEFGMSDESQSNTILQDSDGNLVLGGYQTDTLWQGSPTLLKLDVDGNEIFKVSYRFDLQSEPYRINQIMEAQNGDYILVGHRRYAGESTNIYTGFILRTDRNGNVVWQQEIGDGNSIRFEDVFENAQGEIILTGIHTPLETGMLHFASDVGILFTHLDSNGNIITSKKIETEFQNPHWGLEIKPIDDNGNYAISGSQIFPSYFPEAIGLRHPILVLVDSNGVAYSQNTFQLENVGEAFNLEIDPDGGFYLLGGMFYDFIGYLNNAYGTYILKTNAQGQLYEGNISGNVYRDNDFDCSETTGDIPLDGLFVKAEGAETFYGYTNEDGSYNITCDTGEYIVTVTPPNAAWGLDCAPNGQSVQLIDTLPTQDSLDFFLSPTYNCPVLDVNLSIGFLRRCFENNIHVSYCNEGLVDEQNTIIEVTLDPFLEYVGSTLPFTSQSGNTFTFDVGLLPQGECDGFKIVTYLNCDDTVLGQTHCNEAHIYPDTLCFPQSPNWDESEVQVEVECEGDSVNFRIENIGSGNMSEGRMFYVFEDHIMREQGDVQLNSNEVIIFSYPKNGATWRFVVEQSEEHPNYSVYESAVVEGCVVMEGDPFNLGMVNIFGDFSEEPFEDVHCEANVGSYDPNDKAAVPFGYEEEHYIKETDMLDYKIRFQNTGTDTAFTVVIRDQISEHLDPTTIRNVIASHPFVMDLSQNGLLEFTFNNIHLPDSTTNEPESHGFVQFKIDQQKNNPLGTVIENEASIYFDFNEPIITNTTYHTIGEDFYLVSSIEILEENQHSIEVFPNPFIQETMIRIKEKTESKFRIEMYRVDGKNILTEDFENEFLFRRNNLPPGIYFFKIKSLDDGKTYAGKIVIQ